MIFNERSLNWLPFNELITCENLEPIAELWEMAMVCTGCRNMGHNQIRRMFPL